MLSISFGSAGNITDVPLLFPSRDLRNWDYIRNYLFRCLPLSATCPWLMRSWPGVRLLNAAFPTGFQVPRDPMLNVYRHPVGASRFGHGWFIASSNEIRTIQGGAFSGTGGVPGSPVLVNLNMSSPGIRSAEKVVIPVYIIAMTPLWRKDVDKSATPNQDYINGLYCITVADQRLFWWDLTAPDFKVTNTKTWDAMINDCSTVMGINISYDPIPSAYLRPNVLMDTGFEVLPIVLDSIAANIGQRVVLDYSGKVTMQNPTTAFNNYKIDQQENSSRTVRLGGLRFQSQL